MNSSVYSMYVQLINSNIVSSTLANLFKSSTGRRNGSLCSVHSVLCAFNLKQQYKCLAVKGLNIFAQRKTHFTENVHDGES